MVSTVLTHTAGPQDQDQEQQPGVHVPPGVLQRSRRGSERSASRFLLFMVRKCQRTSSMLSGPGWRRTRPQEEEQPRHLMGVLTY